DFYRAQGALGAGALVGAGAEGGEVVRAHRERRLAAGALDRVWTREAGRSPGAALEEWIAHGIAEDEVAVALAQVAEARREALGHQRGAAHRDLVREVARAGEHPAARRDRRRGVEGHALP